MSARHPPASPDRAGTIANLANDSALPHRATTKNSGRLLVIVAQESAKPFVTFDSVIQVRLHILRKQPNVTPPTAQADLPPPHPYQPHCARDATTTATTIRTAPANPVASPGAAHSPDCNDLQAAGSISKLVGRWGMRTQNEPKSL